MQISAREYPHPVMADFSDDFVTTKFSSSIENPILSNGKYVFIAEMSTDNHDLQKLIMEENACFVAHIECPSSGFRELYRSYESQFTFEIPSDKLIGRVDINSLILASDNIVEYQNYDFHPAYKDYSFSVMKADVLAVGEHRKINIKKDIESLRKVPSIFRVVEDKRVNAPSMVVELANPYVKVKMSSENFKSYQRLLKANESFQSLLNSLIVVPALSLLLKEYRSIE
ncbi:hypothetical protein [Brevibacillus brevis]|uniref:hypothetical protein n=1 Tax=Brevibacillus brevis TaxID=1393 RepID=UPI000D0EE5D2|nr:hypothetical protein [Brevibacillus brevis]PSJ63546.1 hypothetical protein C7J99_31300 [Brevibacillus brevis]RED33847.1 hypothetical protein DES34_10212 [Brevibacillus brevis]GEC93338.1 hypothetical protein BBR01nite_56690 [Brevibacillus brevis]VEF92583.1 Uncharacterised protein [Brevibacillus brevis]